MINGDTLKIDGLNWTIPLKCMIWGDPHDYGNPQIHPLGTSSSMRARHSRWCNNETIHFEEQHINPPSTMLPLTAPIWRIYSWQTSNSSWEQSNCLQTKGNSADHRPLSSILSLNSFFSTKKRESESEFLSRQCLWLRPRHLTKCSMPRRKSWHRSEIEGNCYRKLCSLCCSNHQTCEYLCVYVYVRMYLYIYTYVLSYLPTWLYTYAYKYIISV